MFSILAVQAPDSGHDRISPPELVESALPGSHHPASFPKCCAEVSFDPESSEYMHLKIPNHKNQKEKKGPPERCISESTIRGVSLRHDSAWIQMRQSRECQHLEKTGQHFGTVSQAAADIQDFLRGFLLYPVEQIYYWLCALCAEFCVLLRIPV